MSRTLTKEQKAKILARCVDDAGCLVWTGACADGTSPQVRIDGKTLSLRRVLWEDERGPIPAGMQVTVTCATKRCVKHIKPATHAEIISMRPGAGCFNGNAEAHGRRIAQAKRAKSDLDEADAAKIRCSAEPATVLCERYNLSHAYTAAIKRGTKRRDLSSPMAGMFTGLLAANDQQRARA